MNVLDKNMEETSFPIISYSGKMIGFIDSINTQSKKIIIEGWTCADEVGVLVGLVRTTTQPAIHRPDVTKAHPALVLNRKDDKFGFYIEVDNVPKEDNIFIFLKEGNMAHYIKI